MLQIVSCFLYEMQYNLTQLHNSSSITEVLNQLKFTQYNSFIAKQFNSSTLVPFDPPENIRKRKYFAMFTGGSKGNVVKF